MFALIVSVFTYAPVRAEEITIQICQARCMIMQTGRVAQREIAATPRTYRSNTRLVDYGKRISGGSIEELHETCDEIARDVNWWRPGMDVVSGRLIADVDVDTSDDVNAVRAWTEITECQLLPAGLEFGDKFAPTSMDALERNFK